MIEEPQVLSDRSRIDELIRYSKRSGIDTLFVQVYRSNRSWFSSQVADPSLFDKARKDLGEDPLALLIQKAHRAHIKVHAWVNLLSLGGNADAPILKKYGASILTRGQGPKKELDDYKIDNQFFLEPSDPRVRRSLKVLVRELLTAYPGLDGIQFDYIRYPDVHPFYGYSEDNVKNYLRSTGKTSVREEDESWKEWKRSRVTDLLKELVREARSIRPKITVSTTGCVPYVRALYEAYQDWPLWLNSGLVDFVTVMDYSADPKEFGRFLTEARFKTKYPEKMNVAVGAYKPVTTPESFAAQWRLCEKADCGACVAFYYGSLLERPALAEALLYV